MAEREAGRGVKRGLVGAVKGGWALMLLMTFLHCGTAAAQQSSTLAEAVRAFEDGRIADAETVFERLVEGPTEASARLYLGRIHFGREEWDEAEDHLERAVELRSDDAELTYWLGNTYLRHIADVSIFSKRGMAEKALTTLRRALELDPDHVDARVSLAEYYLNAPGIAGGSKDKAREQVAEIIARDPRRGFLFQAAIHEDDEAWNAAESAYEEALRAAPGDAEVLYAAGMFHQGREAWERAFSLLEEAAAAPVVPETRVFVRASLYQVGRTGALSGRRLDRSIEALTAFSRRFPDYEDALSPGAHWRRGMLHEMKGDIDAARAAYEAALAIEPDYEQAEEALRELGR